ncbi:prephenate dehydratase [Vagococcus hydrophili]|uniref:Prephenate dehydratase n=1 Tax=Vagococcus hydrophili TaxID=2714947 RepID=A0A6G8AWL7_9ENTE|nr:prephenate dehydratase [Vagococcus hydrophili]QIL49407.1 prephenate dehydratase [Vagococcus hydrophili]
MKVGYLGPVDSFTYSATTFLFDKETTAAYPTIVSCLKNLESGNIDYAVVPIENSIEGTVNQTLDFIFHHSTHLIQAEVILPINQNLMVHPNFSEEWRGIDTVRSHPQALAQTQEFLSEWLPEAKQEVSDSTTQAAEWLYDNPNKKMGAIASKEAAVRYGLSIVKEKIQDIPNNQTRFWVLGKEALKKGSLKKELCRQTMTVSMKQNQPGNLHKILSAFSWREIDLTKIESRPLKTKLGDYFFLLDIKAKDSFLIDSAIQEIEALGGTVKNFGSYDVYLKKI